jgi:hypothetical protein
LFDTGDYARVLVVPCNDKYYCIRREHLYTLIHTCQETEGWQQEDGSLDEEIVEKIGLLFKLTRLTRKAVILG